MMPPRDSPGMMSVSVWKGMGDHHEVGYMRYVRMLAHGGVVAGEGRKVKKPRKNTLAGVAKKVIIFPKEYRLSWLRGCYSCAMGGIGKLNLD